MAKKSSAITTSKPAPATKPAPRSTAPIAAGGNGSPAGRAAPTIVTAVTHDQIARKAYEIWVAKGRPVGKDVENWQEAERVLGVRK